MYRVLDAFSCKGGGGLGYAERASVTAVDIVDYSDAYPAGNFIQADAVEFIARYGRQYSLIHISAPCQPWTRGNAPRRYEGADPAHPQLVAAAREAAKSTGRPYVIENVEDAKSQLVDPICLCGRMFDLHAYDDHPDANGMKLILRRHRLFEFGNMPRPDQPAHPKHHRTSGIGYNSSGQRILTGQPHVAGVYSGARRDPWEAKYVRGGGYVPKSLRVLQDLLGTPHIDTEKELFEAIPPAYTRWVFDHFLETI